MRSLPIFATAVRLPWAASACAVGILFVLGGCSQWGKPQEKAEFQFPRGRMAPNSVAFELAVAQVPGERLSDLDRFWGELDSLEIDLSIRRRLDQNGLRAAVMPAHLPKELEKVLKPVELSPAGLDTWQRELDRRGLLKGADPLVFHTRAQRRAGEPYRLASSDVWPEQSWVLRIDDRQTPGVGQNVQGAWEIETFPRGDGSVRIRLTPVIQHGDVRPQIGVEQGNFLFEARQSELALDELAIETSLLPGESLIVGATADLGDLGHLFFRPTTRIKPDDFRRVAEEEPVPPGEQRLLMVRLVQTQMDDLFGWTEQARGSDSLR